MCFSKNSAFLEKYFHFFSFKAIFLLNTLKLPPDKSSVGLLPSSPNTQGMGFCVAHFAAADRRRFIRLKDAGYI
uniref:Uncharacterized protein n=1 Tax=Magnetococcus massalia (strain MO-1) TaxID=451514 RepID=A0A1S7LIK4_MAGMO|nr:protein of unknown function [Candidatus Magnetococcus massalia]